MKIAIVTADGKTVNQHFGRSPYYAIVTVEDNKVVKTEMRQRGTGHFAANQEHNHEEHDHSKGHGFGAGDNDKHDAMSREIGDCQVLIAGGMGRGAYQRFFMNGINVVMTDEASIDNVVSRYISGNLPNLYEQRTH